MLGQSVSMLIPPPKFIGFRLSGKLTRAHRTDSRPHHHAAAARKRCGREVRRILRPGVSTLPLADRATSGNMAPEYGATIGIFPVDQETLRYLEFHRTAADQVKLVEAYMKEQGLFHTPDATEAVYTDTLELNLATVEPSMAGPRRPQDRVGLRSAAQVCGGVANADEAGAGAGEHGAAGRWEGEAGRPDARRHRHGRSSAKLVIDDVECEVHHGSVVIARDHELHQHVNPSVMVAAALMAKKAVDRGLAQQTVVKTSLAPGSKVVTDYLEQAGLMKPLEALRFHLGATAARPASATPGPLPRPFRRRSPNAISSSAPCCRAIRNFEGRISRSAGELPRLAGSSWHTRSPAVSTSIP